LYYIISDKTMKVSKSVYAKSSQAPSPGQLFSAFYKARYEKATSISNATGNETAAIQSLQTLYNEQKFSKEPSVVGLMSFNAT